LNEKRFTNTFFLRMWLLHFQHHNVNAHDKF
jgi:hypothetical protein